MKFMQGKTFILTTDMRAGVEVGRAVHLLMSSSMDLRVLTKFILAVAAMEIFI